MWYKISVYINFVCQTAVSSKDRHNISKVRIKNNIGYDQYFG